MTSLAPDGPDQLLSSPATANPSSSPTTNDIDNPLILELLAKKAEAEKDNQWASWVESEYLKCKNARAPFERQWFLNLAFVAGKQYVAPVEIAGQGFRLASPKAPPWRVRLVINKCRTAIRTECSKLTTSKPIPTVLPSTNENEDLSASRIAELLLKNHFRTAEFEKTYRSWIWWGVVCGNSYIKSFWDASAEDYTTMQKPPLPMLNGQPVPPQIIEQDPRLKQYMETPIPAKGKIFTERVSPFHIFVPDLLSEDINDQPYVIQVMTRTPLWVKNKFGFEPTCDVKASSTVMEAATVISRGSEQHLDGVLVKEVWIKKNGHPDFPEGGVLTIINGRVVQKVTKWPWPFPEYPFYKYDGIPTGGFYSDSVMVDLIPLQKEYNRTRSQIVEIKNTMGKPRFFYQQGSINPKKISSEPNQAIPYTAGYQPPIVMPAAEVPATMVNEINTLTAEFDDISGQHEITRGSTPSQVTSGTAIAFLQEQDDTKLSYQVASIENCIEVLGRHYLEYVAKYWDAPRIIKVTGRDNTYESMKWKGSDLKGNTDVKVQTGSALPYSKAARSAMITEWMQSGYLDPVMGFELLDMPVLSKAIDELLADKKQVQRENAKMADAPVELVQMLMNPAPGPNDEPPFEIPNPEQGKPPIRFNGDQTPFQPKPIVPVNSWDNHEAHIHYHNEFRKTQEFELLDESIKQAFELHVQLHQFALMSTMINAQGQPMSPQNSAVGVEEEQAGAETNEDGDPQQSQ